MKFYGVITNAYANEVLVSARNYLPDYLCTLRLFAQCNRPQKRGFIVSYVNRSIHYAIPKLSPSARLHCIHQGLHTSPKIVVQVTSVAKQPDAAAQSIGFENVD
jgi:hypothetical protein